MKDACPAPRCLAWAGHDGDHPLPLTRTEVREMAQGMARGALVEALLRGPDIPGAACKDKDPQVWYAEVFSRDKPNPLASHTVRVAKSICSGCPVRKECLSEELEYEAKHGPQPGIRGGALPSERRSGDVDTILEQMDEQAKKHGLRNGRAA